MSEANAPLNRPDPSAPQGTPTAEPGWENPFTALVEEALESSAADPLFEQDSPEQEALKQELLKQELLKWEDNAALAQSIEQSPAVQPTEAQSPDSPEQEALKQELLKQELLKWEDNAALAQSIEQSPAAQPTEAQSPDSPEQEALKQELLKQELLKWEDNAALAQSIKQSPAVQPTEAQSPDAPLVEKPADTPISRPSLPDPTAVIAAWSENAANTAEPTDITDLISLLQELNQCNSILLDRVSQLEEALESSQIALQAEVGRSQDYQTIVSQTPEDLASAQEQIVSLFNQLEFAHQTHQRQQILIETLTGQLETSQERVSQLERESALLQQHYNERLQQLAQAEATNRDLQARLHRQQRYTLQFKVALEKCLEVPAPQYDLGEATSTLDEQSFLPKTQRIQPWAAANEILTPRAAWMKLHTLGLEGLDEPEAVIPLQPTIPIQDASSKAAFPAPIETANSETEPPQTQEPHLKRSVIQLPVTQSPELAPAEPVLADPALIEQIDTAMRPLADRLADAIRKGTSIQEAVQSLAIDLPEPTSSNELPPELPIKLSPELLTESPAPARQPINQSTSQPTVEPVAAPAPVQPNTDAEDDLWQDLARLIEVSTEDIVKASLSGDLSAFEAIDFEALQPQETLSAGPEAVSHPFPQTTSSPTSQSSQTNASTSPLPNPLAETPVAPESTQSESFIPGLTHSSWPSPVIHPLRPTKKQRSPGTVDLPSFVRPDTHPGMA
ncbi:hypothetical protein IFO70_08340 [Phormidium tenue FACHB-886]|nr:hypothetical protein [Phormidium tenue FACHB-886]